MKFRLFPRWGVLQDPKPKHVMKGTKSSSVHYLRGRREGQQQRNALFKPGFFLLGTKRLEKMEQQINDNVHGNPNLNIRTGTTNGVSKKCTEHTKSSRFKETMSRDFLLQVFS
jgi:hypothetical protein